MNFTLTIASYIRHIVMAIIQQTEQIFQSV